MGLGRRGHRSGPPGGGGARSTGRRLAPEEYIENGETMETTGPLVSIGMPLYNAARYLRLALEALLRQDYPHFELLIADNASTDETGDICREYATRDARIQYYRNPLTVDVLANYNRV